MALSDFRRRSTISVYTICFCIIKQEELYQAMLSEKCFIFIYNFSEYFYYSDIMYDSDNVINGMKNGKYSFFFRLV